MADLGTKYEETADVDVILSSQRCSGVETEMWVISNKKEILKAINSAQIVDNQERALNCGFFRGRECDSIL